MKSALAELASLSSGARIVGVEVADLGEWPQPGPAAVAV